MNDDDLHLDSALEEVAELGTSTTNMIRVREGSSTEIHIQSTTSVTDESRAKCGDQSAQVTLDVDIPSCQSTTSEVPENISPTTVCETSFQQPSCSKTVSEMKSCIEIRQPKSGSEKSRVTDDISCQNLFIDEVQATMDSLINSVDRLLRSSSSNIDSDLDFSLETAQDTTTDNEPSYQNPINDGQNPIISDEDEPVCSNTASETESSYEIDLNSSLEDKTEIPTSENPTIDHVQPTISPPIDDDQQPSCSKTRVEAESNTSINLDVFSCDDLDFLLNEQESSQVELFRPSSATDGLTPSPVMFGSEEVVFIFFCDIGFFIKFFVRFLLNFLVWYGRFVIYFFSLGIIIFFDNMPLICPAQVGRPLCLDSKR